ncbi:cyclin-U1-1 isoform X2 [Actinidia eriantha]|uniref:cyclin-U1-1 isoform X2 n=1 Tax=Actinidia eriantha TaxID=165200 RepID=UPI0025874579|nr:cyclin-U1-1 isoform X2 [Actinidia eriantha]
MLAAAAADDTHLRRLEPSPAETATPRVLTIIAFVLDRLVARNDRLVEQSDGGVGWGSSRVGTSLSTFHGVRAPSIRIGKYLERIYKYTDCSPSCFVVGHFNNAFYARVGGVSNSELNRLELELLFLLDFGVTVSSRVFESYCMHLEKEMLWNGMAQKVERVLTPNGVEDVTEMPLEDAQSSSPSTGTMS